MDRMIHPADAALAPYELMALKVVLMPSHRELLLPPMTAAIVVLSLILFRAGDGCMQRSDLREGGCEAPNLAGTSCRNDPHPFAQHGDCRRRRSTRIHGAMQSDASSMRVH
ncbi:MAG: hypothetical protein C0434_08225 [Xanthomonadaceae bacterium]|nr:hypothetical protein [Xanthomonadaceae bacterium]